MCIIISYFFQVAKSYSRSNWWLLSCHNCAQTVLHLFTDVFTLMDVVFLQGLEWTKELRTMMLLCTCSLVLRGDLQQNLLYLTKVYTTSALSAFGEIYFKSTYYYLFYHLEDIRLLNPLYEEDWLFSLTLSLNTFHYECTVGIITKCLAAMGKHQYRCRLKVGKEWMKATTQWLRKCSL